MASAEVMNVALDVLKTTGQKFDFSLEYETADIGGIAIDNHGVAFPESTREVCDRSEAILFGSVGGPKWESSRPKINPNVRHSYPFAKPTSSMPMYARPPLCRID